MRLRLHILTLFALWFVLFTPYVSARAKLQGYVEQGNTTLTITGGIGTIAKKVQGSFPGATVTLYDAVTGVPLVNCYADNAGTAKPCSFTSSADGSWYVYLDDGRYDVRFSGTGITVPFTIGDITNFDSNQFKTDLADTSNAALGDAMVGYKGSGTSATSRTVHDRFIDLSVNVMDYMTPAQIADIRAGTALVDVTAAVLAANTEAGSSGTLRIPSGTYLIAGDLALTARISWEGGVFSVATGKTLTLTGIQEGSISQRFAGAGTKVFTGNKYVDEVYPEWWANNTTPGVTDMTSAIQAAIDSMGLYNATSAITTMPTIYGGGTVRFQRTMYLVTSTLKYSTSKRFVGEGISTIIQFNPSSHIDLFYPDLTYGLYAYHAPIKVVWERLRLNGDRTVTALGTGNAGAAINARNLQYSTVNDCMISNFEYGIHGTGTQSQFISLTDCFIINNIHNVDTTLATMTCVTINGGEYTHSDTATGVGSYNIRVDGTLELNGVSIESNNPAIIQQVYAGGSVALNGARSEGIGGGGFIGMSKPLAFRVISLDGAQHHQQTLAYDDLEADGVTVQGSGEFGGGVNNNGNGTFANMVQNGSFRYGITHWGVNANIITTQVTNNDFGSKYAMTVTNVVTGALRGIHQTIEPYIHDFFVTVLVKPSVDCVLSFSITGAHGYIMQPKVDYGNGWYLYSAWIGGISPGASIGLNHASTSATGASFLVTNVQAYVGGFPLISAEYLEEPVPSFVTLDDAATPSVLNNSLFLTGGVTAITNFTNGYTGQTITIVAEHGITITDGTNIFLSGSVNFNMSATDTLTLICKPDGKWYELARSDNT